MAHRRPKAFGQGIYPDAHGITVIARIGSGTTLQSSAPVRFALVDADGIPYSRRHNRELVECYLRLRAALVDARRASGGTGSLGLAIEAFLAAHPVVPGAKNETRCRDLKHLLAPWRTSALAALTVTTPIATLRPQIAQCLETWATTPRAPGQPPLAASTVNRRKYALAAVFQSIMKLDADGVQTLPTDKIADIAPPKYAPRGIDPAIVARILSMLPDVGRAKTGETRPPYSETKIRLRVMAWTGLTRIDLVRLTKKRVDFAQGKIYYPPREKGKGAAGLWVDVLPSALEALRDYDAARLWGTNPSKSSMYKSWRAAVRNTRAALAAAAETDTDAPADRERARRMLAQFDVAVPENCHPYDLRHAFGTETYRRSKDIYATKAIMRHATITTTERYVAATVPDNVAAAIDAMRAFWFPDAKKPSGTVRDFQLVPKTGA